MEIQDRIALIIGRAVLAAETAQVENENLTRQNAVLLAEKAEREAETNRPSGSKNSEP